jgi:hypothetical protein
MRSKVRHGLKTWPEFFEATNRGQKKFELRRDDRPEGFRVGDELLLQEFDPAAADTPYLEDPKAPEGQRVKINGYTGRALLVRVDYVMPVETVDSLMGLSESPADPGFGFVIMSVSLVS